MARIAVIGLGNVLMGDDAVGPYVVRVLEAGFEFPDGVTVEDLGTPGLDLAPYVVDLDLMIVVDTIRTDAPPGTVKLYRRDDVLRNPPQTRLSPHDPGLKEAILFADLEGRGPREVLVVGVVPGRCETGVGLSPAVREAIDSAAAEVLRELERAGRPARPRSEPLEREPWWESPSLALVRNSAPGA